MAAGCLGPAALEEQELLLHRGEVLALGSRLREALETYSAALHLGPLRPEQLGVLVDCLLRSYRARQGSDQVPVGLPTPMLQCPGCRRRFLARPVVAPCGHCYCSRCLCGGLRARCRLCGGQLLGPGQEAARARPCVLLAQLAHKWFPRESGRARVARRVWRLLRAGSPLAALRAAEEALETEPSDLILRVYSAESHAGLHEFETALEELNALLLKAPDWSEVYYWKAIVLHATGSVNDSLELFLQCLALDEDFLPAKLEIEKILCDLLSPVPEDVKEGLKESSWSSPAHIRNKPFMLATETEESENHPILCPEQTSEVPKTDNECFRTGLNRAQSVYVLNSVEEIAKEDGLKRVSSEPLLSGEEKGSLLKRKLSASEQERPVYEDARNKHKKQEEILAMSFACETIPLDLVDAADFECSLCIRLLFEPVTTPCGHTFCKKCLERCLDHSPQCPLCKENLTTYLARRKYIITQLLEELIMKYLPDDFEERKRMFDEETAELSNLTQNVPVFVCTMAYPTVPCPLHVFEPRYRLMIRRCMETGTKQFGMCASDPQKSFADYGCMLQIRNVHFLPDGRSVVDTVGGKRFRVLQRQMKDGYHTADIEYLEDEKIEDDEELQQLQELNDVVYNEACCWFQNLKNKFRNQILHHFGPMPERTNILQETSSGPSWCWWLIAVLPVDPKYQLSVLSMTSLKERLMKLQQILAYFSREQPK